MSVVLILVDVLIFDPIKLSRGLNGGFKAPKNNLRSIKQFDRGLILVTGGTVVDTQVGPRLRISSPGAFIVLYHRCSTSQMIA